MTEDTPENKKRPFVGVHYECCNVYGRAYLNSKGDSFEGGCPKCGGNVRLRASTGGSKSRFWKAE